jgi:hypothetical protein
MRRARWLAVVTAILASAPAVATAASPHAPKPVSVAAHFTRSPLGRGFLRTATGGVLITRNNAVTLIDSSTDKATTVATPAGCFLQDASRAQLLLDCGPQQSQELEDIATGQARPVALNPLFACNPATTASCAAGSLIGSAWMALTGECDMDEHCSPGVSFQNLATGEVVNDPTSHTVVPDLDSSVLAQSLCSPVTVPTGSPLGLPFAADVQIDGRFAIATGAAGTYLEECGEKLDQHLSYLTNVLFNHHVVLWESKPGRLQGLFLPSLKPFTITVPRGIDPGAAGVQFVREEPYDLALSEHTLYLLGAAKGQLPPLWSMPMPTRPPKAPKRKPKR